MFFREDRRRREGVADILPWAGFIAPGVAVTKQGLFTAAWVYRGPDLQSSTPEELVAIMHDINRTFRPLGEEWVLHIDSVRTPSRLYSAAGAFPDPVTALLDEERRAQFLSRGGHYQTRDILSASWFTPTERKSRASRWFVSGEDTSGIAWDREVARFEDSLRLLEDGLSAHFAMERLDTAALCRHYHSVLTGKDHPVDLPDPPIYLDAMLASEDLSTGFRPRIGPRSMRVLSIHGFPRKSAPAITDFLHELPFAYRWSTRWWSLGRRRAEKELAAVRRNWWKGRFGIAKEIRSAEAKSHHERQEIERLASLDALAMWTDANRAFAEASSGVVTYGYLSNTLILQGEDEAELDQVVRDVQRIVAQHGFPARIEEPNAIEAFMGSLAGNYFSNVRRPILHTLNLAHLMPTTSVWAGSEFNPSPMFPPNTPPLLWAKTSGSTPFKGNLHVSDVGHAMVVGPTGAGKSVLLAFLGWSFLRYPNAQVFLFDKGYSAYPLCLATRGHHYDLLPEHEAVGPAFAPLARIDRESERLWASQWLLALFEESSLDLEPRDTSRVHEALADLARFPPEQRTLTHLHTVLQSHRLREALEPYTLDGDFGRLLDATRDGFADAHFQVFELSRLMEAGERWIAPTLAYLFHRIETRLSGAPTLICVDEAWSFLLHSQFAAQIRIWIKEARKRNAAVVLATQSLEDLERSREAQILFESTPTKIFLGNEQALNPRGAKFYADLGLNPTQIRIIGHMTPKKEYYWTSPHGRRVIDLELGELALQFLGAGDPESLARIRQLESHYGAEWTVHWLRERRLPEAAEALERQSFVTTRKSVTAKRENITAKRQNLTVKEVP